MTVYEEIVQALHRAIDLERKGQTFYRKAAEQTTHPKGREMFLSLAEDEVLHEQLLQRQLDAVTEGQGWVPLPEVRDPSDEWNKPLFPEGEEEIRKAVHPEASDLDALLFGIQIENDAFNLYRQLAEQAEHPEAKRTFAFLADIERGHFNLLMLNYEHLSTVGQWPD